MDAYTIISSEATCTDAVFGAWSAEPCTDAAEVELNNESEIAMILMSDPDDTDPTIPKYKPTDFTSLSAWETAIDNAGSGIKRLYCVGDMPEPNTNSRKVSNGRESVGDKNFILNVDIDDVNNTNYDESMKHEKGKQVFLWFVTLGKKLYGTKVGSHENGILCNLSANNIILNRGEGNYEVLRLQFTWDAPHKPWRMNSPF